MIESSNLVSPEGASVGPFEIKSPITSTPGCPKSPEIVRMNWGSITIGTEISGVTHTYRDAKLWPGGSRAWDWRETGTGHLPGIQIADIVELLLTDPTHIVLSRGVLGVLQVPQATIDHIKAHPSVQELIIERSYAARNTYNALVSAGHRVAGLIHTTC